MKKLLSKILFVGAAGLALAACGATNSTSSSSSTSSSAASQGTVLKTIEKNKQLRIGVEGTYPPFSYHDTKSGELVGFEVEIAKVIAEDLGVEPVFVETKWDSLIAGLDVNKYDIVINNVGVTEERQKAYDFTDPYFESYGQLAVSKDSGVQTLADYSGKKSAQSTTSNFAQNARDLGAEIVPVDGFNQAVELVSSGRADGTINDYITFLTYFKEHPESTLKLIDEKLPSNDKIGIILQKENTDFQTKLNDIIAKRTEDGTFKQIFEKYLGEDISVGANN
jgi:L-cystine transport system substrate-binding protein